MEYYAGQYDWSDVPAIVDSKVSSGEIKIGPPQVNAAQKLLIIDNGTRYALQDTVQ